MISYSGTMAPMHIWLLMQPRSTMPAVIITANSIRMKLPMSYSRSSTSVVLMRRT